MVAHAFDHSTEEREARASRSLTLRSSWSTIASARLAEVIGRSCVSRGKKKKEFLQMDITDH